MNYHVNVTIQDDSHALAETRGHRLSLNVKKGAGKQASTPLRHCSPRWVLVC